MPEYELVWEPPGYRPISEAAVRTLCDGDAEPALKDMRANALIVRVEPNPGWQE